MIVVYDFKAKNNETKYCRPCTVIYEMSKKPWNVETLYITYILLYLRVFVQVPSLRLSRSDQGKM